MDISKIDKNFALENISETDIEWISAHDERFTLCGVYHDGERYVRLPYEVAKATNDGVANLYKHTSGGRLRFITDSPYVAVKAIIDKPDVMSNMPLTGSAGFAIYIGGVYKNTVRAVYSLCRRSEGDTSAIQGIFRRGVSESNFCEVYFPLYNGVREVYIGVKKDSNISRYDYKKQGRVVFYGSSITQGGCASRPGNDYAAHLSRMLDFDYLNLGFSGSARGEESIASYIASLSDVRVFVLDYDHNAPNVEHLRKTHYPLYATIRAAHPHTPVVFISRPNFLPQRDHIDRRAVIRETYERAMSEGDSNVRFIDGETLFWGEARDACTVDAAHPNDLGFFRMASVIRPILAELL